MKKTGVGEKDGQVTAVPDVIEDEPVDPEVDVKKPVQKNNSGMIVIVLLVIGGAAGGYFYIILLLLSLRASEYLEEWHQAQDICIRLMDHQSEKVRANAALGLAYTARTKGSLDKRIVKPYLLRELRENKECSWRVIDAINDINYYLGWHLAEKTFKEESSI